MKRNTQLILGIISILAAMVAGFYGRNAYLVQISTLTLPVPRRDIPPYTVLTADLFENREFPRALGSMPYFLSPTDLAGQISTTRLAASLPVSKQSAQSVSSFRMAGPKEEVVSIPVRPVSAVGGQVRIGNRVNLYHLKVIASAETTDAVKANEKGKLQGQAELVASSVLVVDVRSSQGAAAGPETANPAATLNTKDQEEQTQILTLAVKPEQVKSILDTVAESENAGGTLWVSLALP